MQSSQTRIRPCLACRDHTSSGKGSRMSQQTISARAKPIREPKAGVRECGYCGRWQSTDDHTPDYYCGDCKPLARQLGWIPPLPTYTCQNCGAQRRGTGRTLCAECKWNTNKQKPKRVRERKPKTPRTPHPLQPCGTKAAHQRHLAHDETPCDPCKTAKANYSKEWRANHKPEPKPKRKRTPEELAQAKERKREYDRARYLRKKGT